VARRVGQRQGRGQRKVGAGKERVLAVGQAGDDTDHAAARSLDKAGTDISPTHADAQAAERHTGGEDHLHRGVTAADEVSPVVQGAHFERLFGPAAVAATGEQRERRAAQ
jgi:hypothetical protein